MRVLLVDLWEGPGHAYYSGPFISAMARKKSVQTAFLHNIRQDLALYPQNVTRFPINAPTNLRSDQVPQIMLQPLEFFRMISKIKRFQPDMIHLIFSYPWFTAVMPLLARKYNFAQTLHDITPHHGEETMRNRLALKALIKYANPVFVHGRQSYNKASELYPGVTNRLNIIPHGHFDFLNPSDEPKPEPEETTFLFFGRILPYKGLNIALRALEIVLREFPETRMIIAGTGSIENEKPLIQKMEKNLEICNRRVDDDDLRKLMRRSLAVLAPYTHASGSGVVATTYAFSTPVIGSRLGGLIDMIVPDKTGWLFEPGDPEQLAGCMKKAVRDKSLMVRLGRNAKEHAKQAWDWNKITDNCVNAYREALSNKGKP